MDEKAKEKLEKICEQFNSEIEQEIDSRVKAAVGALKTTVYTDIEELRSDVYNLREREPELVKMIVTALVDGLSKRLIGGATRMITIAESHEARIAALEKNSKNLQG